MDQLIYASHTHYWYEVGMLKVPALAYTDYGLFALLNIVQYVALVLPDDIGLQDGFQKKVMGDFSLNDGQGVPTLNRQGSLYY